MDWMIQHLNPRRCKNYLFLKISRLALEPAQPSVWWILAVLSPGVKRLGHEADHPPSSSAEIKNEWSYTSTFLVCIYGAYRDNFTFLTLFAGVE
jgi:hypothetical protein